MGEERDLNELIKYIVLSHSALQLQIQLDWSKTKISQPNFPISFLFFLLPAVLFPGCSVPPLPLALFLLNLCKRLSFNEKVRGERRACQIKDRRRLTALTGIYDKHRRRGGGSDGGCGDRVGGGRHC